MLKSLSTIVVSLVCCAYVSVIAAPLPKDKRKKNDDQLIIGDWRLVESGSNGNLTPSNDGSVWRFEANNTATIIRGNGNQDGNIKFTIDFSVTPKKFDWLPNWGQYRGVYTLDQDKLVLYLRSGNDENRVKEAEVQPGVEVYCFVRVTNSK